MVLALAAAAVWWALAAAEFVNGSQKPIYQQANTK